MPRMPRTSTMTYPEWVLPYKTKGREVKFINGRYYLYEISCIYEKETKKRRKKSKYLGILTQAGGLTEPKAVILERLKAPKNIKDFEGGNSEFFFKHMLRFAELLEKHFPIYWQTIIALAYVRLVYQAPLKDVQTLWEKSYLSYFYKDADTSKNSLTKVLKDIGQNRAAVVAYGKEFHKANDTIIFDGTDYLTSSRKTGMAKLSKSKRGSFEYVGNTMWIFSLTEILPLYYRNIPGNIKDMKSFAISMEESGLWDSIAIIDKGMASKKNFTDMIKYHIRFIAAIKRDDPKCDYSRIGQDNATLYDGRFKYQGRTIWYCKAKVDGMYMFLDEELKKNERDDYLNRIDEAEDKGKVNTNYTVEGLEKARRKFGTIGLYTNVSELSAKEVYLKYKARPEIEQMIDVLKNVLDCDKTYMQDKDVLNGWMFTVMVALQWYYSIYHIMYIKDLLKNESVTSVIRFLTNIRRLWVNDHWVLSETTAKEQKLLEALEISIP